MAEPVRDKVFISYSHKDQEWLTRLQTMMRPLIRAGEVLAWDDTRIHTGANWREHIQQALATAKVGVMLVSPNFLASDFIAEVELPSLLTAATEEGLQVCWILVSACLHETSGLDRFQAVHDISRPLDSLTPAELNATLATTAREIQRLATTKLLEQPQPEQPQTDPTLRLPKAERRQITVLVCGLDSAALSERLDLEEVGEVIRDYQTACAEVIHRFEGRITQYLGDGLSVSFGYPLAHEDDALRAVRTGLGIVESMARLNARLQREKGIRLDVRLGIHTGPVVAGHTGVGDTPEPPILGETLNLAARLWEVAVPNAVVISATTYRLIQGVFKCQALDDLSLRGLPQPVGVYRVVQEREDHYELTPLVGREQEMGLLRERWAQVKEGLGQVVVLGGEAGIGKSRLVREVKAHVASEPHARLECRCSPYYQNSALYPVLDLMQRVLQLQRGDAPGAKLGKLEGALARYHMSSPEIVPLLASLLSLPLSEGYPPLTLSPQRQRQKTLEAVLAVLLALAAEQPVLLIVEDLHWVDPSTLELLNLLIDHIPTARVLTLLTCRPDFRPPWGFRAHVTPLTLGRLPRPQVQVLVGRVAGGKALPAEVRQQVAEKTDGVPLFVEELTKMVLESGLLQEREDRYELIGPLRPLAIPATLQESLGARLDRLGSVKEVAQLAATLGRECPYELLRAVSPLDEATLQHGLSRLVEGELLYRRGLPPQVTYIFKHALIQEVAYQSLLKRTRQQYHQRIAQVLAERFPDTAGSHPELLAHHLTEAGLSGPALDYWRRAGQRAIERSAYVEAIGHLTKGLELLKTLPDTSERTQLELMLQMAKSVPLIATQGYGVPEVEQAYARARELCRQLGETPQLFQVLRGLSVFYIARAALQTARELAEQLRCLAQSAQDPTMLVEAHQVLGTALFFLGEVGPARVSLEQGMTLYDPQQHRAHTVLYGGADPGVVCFIYASLASWLLGYPEQALARSYQAVALAHEVSHPFSLAYALDLAAILHRLRREGGATRERAEAAMTLATEQGFPLWLALGAILRGRTLAEQGPRAEGIAQIRQGLAGLQATGTELARPYVLALLAEAYGQGGKAEEGLSVLTEAWAAVQKTGERWWEAELCRLQGELVLARSPEDGAEAEALFRQALDVASSQQAKSLELRAAMSLSRLWRHQGKRVDARGVLAPIYSWFTEGFGTGDLQEARALLDELSSQ
jgi:class 3 adenylate cyclase/predicted ATPase